ncbi:MAG: GDSL-type esterase/lipase family protein [Gemmataceae bacterium]
MIRPALVLAVVAALSSAAPANGADVPTDGLILWYHAGAVEVKDGSVQTLLDQSGKKNHARRQADPKDVPANPTVVANADGGKPVLRFSGEHAAFEFDRAGNIRTAFWVVRKDRSALQTYIERFVMGDTKSRHFHPGTHFTDSILCGGRDPLSDGKAWLNGKPVKAAKTDFPAELGLVTLESTDNVEANLIAKDRAFFDRCWKGDIAEILLFDRALSDDDRKAVEGYLTKKYNLPTELPAAARPSDHVFFKGKTVSGNGRRVVLVAGDDEYKSEESMPLLAHILAEKHGFDCTVLFAQDPATGVIEHGRKDHIPGLESLRNADLLVLFTRFRCLPDDQMRHLAAYLDSKPVIGLRTATHAFAYPPDSKSPFAKYTWNNAKADFPGGFGRQVLGQTWVNHWGGHGKQSTRGKFAPDAATHPILKGIKDGEIWGPTDVYEATLPLPAGCSHLLLGEVLRGMKPDDPPAPPEFIKRLNREVDKNAPMHPVAWTYSRPVGAKGRVFTTTMGGAMAGGSDFDNEGFRRMMVNACYWAVGLEAKIPDKSDVSPVWKANPYRRGVKLADPEPAKSPPADPGLEQYGIYGKTAPRAAACDPVETALPLLLKEGDRVALIGNTLLERLQEHGHFEAYLQKRFSEQRLTVRNLTWPADEITLRPRPENFADLEQHLTHERADIILAAFGFNESFAGEAGLPKFKKDLAAFLAGLKAKAFNGKTAPRIVLISPIGNENVSGVPAATLNGARLQLYVDAMREVALEQKVGFADVYEATAKAMAKPDAGLTFNGVHLTASGYDLFSRVLFSQLFGEEPPALIEPLRKAVIDKDLQFNRRYRPLNSFYYTGDRNKLYGYLDFLPAMRNFDMMVANRDRHIWAIAQGKAVPPKVDDSNVPALPPVDQSRGVNTWLTPAEEQKAFKVDPRFDVNLFASEEQFPEIANPIQMRWDARGRLWVSCSSTYPHTYPGKEPRDRLVILEDTDGDGKADKSTVFAEDLHVPLSFEFGDEACMFRNSLTSRSSRTPTATEKPMFTVSSSRASAPRTRTTRSTT